MIAKLKKKQEKGFALIEVMIAALVLTLGCLAFLKLQRTGMQYAFNDYARSQGVAITQGFAEKLRGNVRFLNTSIDDGSISSTDTRLSSNLPQKSTHCQPDPSTIACAKAMFDYQRYLTAQQMKMLLKGQSLLCYEKEDDDDKYGAVRLTFIWVDSSASEKAKKEGLETSDCPDDFDDEVDKDFRDNSVTIYVQL